MIDPKIRKYELQDKQILLEILRINTPDYFSPDEEKFFINYLDNEIDFYYVLEIENKIIGCGGINLPNDKSIGVISWGMLHPAERGFDQLKIIQNQVNSSCISNFRIGKSLINIFHNVVGSIESYA